MALYNVPDKSRRWYLKYVEDYIKAHPGRPLKQHTEQYPTKYLNDLGGNEHLQTWQFKQAIDAIRSMGSE